MPKPEIFGNTIPSPAFTLASLSIAAYSLALRTSMVLTTCWEPIDVLNVNLVSEFLSPDFVVITITPLPPFTP